MQAHEIEPFLAEMIKTHRKRLTQRYTEGEDILQRACIAFAKHAPDQDFEGSKDRATYYFRSMIKQVIRNIRWNEGRKAYTVLNYHSSYVINKLNSVDVHRAATYDQTIAEKAHELLDEITDPKAKRVCRLHYVEGYTVDEITALGPNAKGGVQGLIKRGLDQIRQALAERGEIARPL